MKPCLKKIEEIYHNSKTYDSHKYLLDKTDLMKLKDHMFHKLHVLLLNSIYKDKFELWSKLKKTLYQIKQQKSEYNKCFHPQLCFFPLKIKRINTLSVHSLFNFLNLLKNKVFVKI